jgi:rRNA maturation protein Nop10
MKLKKCPSCKKYTLEKECSKCKSETKEAHYKYIKIRDAPKNSDPRKIRKK